MGGSFSTKSDVYGIGVVMWEMITRTLKGEYEKPFSDINVVHDFQILMQAAHQEETFPNIKVIALLD